MNVTQLSVTAATTLIAVALGGWLTVLVQDRLWKRDQQRQWRDIRLAAYTNFLRAFREYVAYVLQPSVRIIAVPRPRAPHDLMPFFDEKGSTYKESLEATKTTLRLISGRQQVVQSSNAMIRHARSLAAGRATGDIDGISPELFERLWSAEREFVLAARDELGLSSDFEIGDRPAADEDSAGGPRSISPLAAWVQEAQ